MMRPLRLVPLLVALALALLPSPAPGVEGDVVFKRQGASPDQPPSGETPVATFPHWFHRIRFKCYACHPQIFQMKAGTAEITMDAIVEGKFCGTCHNDKIAWGVSFETCNRCHAGK